MSATMTEKMSADSGAGEAQHSHRAVVWVLIVLGTVVMVLSTLNTWVERRLLDTDAWVETSSKLLDHDDVRQELSVRLVNALYENVDVGPAIDERLPADLQGLGDPLAGVLRDPLVGTADRLLETGSVREVWRESNRTAHGGVVAILEDDVGDNLSTSDGKVVIDLGGVVVQLGDQIGLPQGVLDSLPEDAGVFEVVESDRLEAAQNGVRVIKILSAVFFLLVVILYGVAIYLAGNRRREAVRDVGFAIALGGFVVVVALGFGINLFAGSPDTEGGRAAADAILVIGTASLRQTAWLEIAIGVLIALGASLIGPARYGRWVRHYAAQGFRQAPVMTWIGLAVLVLAMLVWSPFTVGSWLAGLIIVGLVVIGIEAIRRTSLAEAEATLLAQEAILLAQEATIVDATAEDARAGVPADSGANATEREARPR
jgi:hypothetical protein